MGLHTMKTFKDFLTESKKTYKFQIKIAGELPEGFADTMKSNLEKFELVKLSAPKRTPIQESPLDFPQMQNMEVNVFEAEVNYPTTSHVLQHYLADNCMIAKNRWVVRGENDPLERQQNIKENEPYEALLTQPNMGGESAQDKVGQNRVMDLLKELEIARKERHVEPAGAVTSGKSKQMDTKENASSVIGS
jgi:hypothetical protein